MERKVLPFFVCIAIVYSGCTYDGTLPEYETIPAPTTEVSGPPGESANASLPSSYGPLGQSNRSLRQAEEAFQNTSSLRQREEYRQGEDAIYGAPRLSASELRAIAEETAFSLVQVSGCSLEALKAFVASDWAPVVVISSSVGPEHVQAVVGYDDSTEQLTLVDPENYAQTKLEYSEFSNQWSDPQKTCLLVFSQYVGAEEIRNTLKKYLPEEKVEIDNY